MSDHQPRRWSTPQVVIALVLIAAVVAGGAWWLSRDDGEEVDRGAAVRAVEAIIEVEDYAALDELIDATIEQCDDEDTLGLSHAVALDRSATAAAISRALVRELCPEQLDVLDRVEDG